MAEFRPSPVPLGSIGPPIGPPMKPQFQVPDPPLDSLLDWLYLLLKVRFFCVILGLSFSIRKVHIWVEWLQLRMYFMFLTFKTIIFSCLNPACHHCKCRYFIHRTRSGPDPEFLRHRCSCRSTVPALHLRRGPEFLRDPEWVLLPDWLYRRRRHFRLRLRTRVRQSTELDRILAWYGFDKSVCKSLKAFLHYKHLF
jgi:hypothetical protein